MPVKVEAAIALQVLISNQEKGEQSSWVAECTAYIVFIYFFKIFNSVVIEISNIYFIF